MTSSRLGKTVLDMSMSVDGFIAGPNDSKDLPLGEGGHRLHEWMFADATGRGKEILARATDAVGATIMGRRTFDMIDNPDGWRTPDGEPFALPVFVLTPRAAPSATKGATTFVFVDDGIESALTQARHAAGELDISIMGAKTGQQFIRAGLLDRLELHIVHILLGGGVRLFEAADAGLRSLSRTGSEEGPGVSHLSFQLT